MLILAACSKDPRVANSKPEPPIYDIFFRVPPGWPKPVYNYQNNTLTEAGFKLGRKLFYDTKLSRDNTTSCGSCHQQFAGFAHSAHPLSHGIDGQFGTRNAPTISNLNWYPEFMWDGGINHIEIMPLAPITNPVEMDEDINAVVTKLNNDATYQKMFIDAFGDNTINSQRIFKAITQFQGMLISFNSKYDKYLRKEAGGEMTTSELKGFNLFNQKCISCHIPPLFTDFSFRNNGLSYNAALKDSGRAHITGLATDMNRFKVPTLRNVAVTRPYMHDGRFQSLVQCLNHYNNGIQQTQNLDSLLINGIALDAQEIQD
ncbi:MAG TPA: cytochrome c peroxidase, partial [Bacteroidia bacterium]|nr:cytochrome c peroxidase [Bacteroidia bacterium]